MAKVKKAPKLNVQGLARRDPLLMRCLIPDSGNLVVSIDLCFPPETDLLTRRGWVPVLEIRPDDDVWQVDRDTLAGSFTRPSRIIKYDYSGDMVTYKTVRGNLSATRGHGMLLCGQYSHSRKDKHAWRADIGIGDPIPSKAAHLTCFSFNNSGLDSDYTERDIWIACLLQADASYNAKYDRYSIQVSKPRKRDMIAHLLGKRGRVYATRVGHTMPTEAWSYLDISSPLVRKNADKTFDLSTLGSNQADLFVEALCFWDGSFIGRNKVTGRFTWTTSSRESAEEVQRYLVTSGYEARLSIVGEQYYQLSIKKHGQIRLYSSRRKQYVTENVSHYQGAVGCVTVQSGYILVRQGGQCFVTSNCAGEPTIVAEMSKDPVYRYAVFDGVGKPPFYKDGLLYIDDIYIMMMSQFPMYSQYIHDLFHNHKFDGKSFAEQWLIDKEVIIKHVKNARAVSKLGTLGKMYGMGPTTMVNHMYNKGFTITPKDSKTFHSRFWNTLDGVRRFAKAAQRTVERDRKLVNPFGYRCVPEPHKAFNAYIQSSVNGIIGVFCIKLFAIAPYATLVTIIHDELIVEVPKDKIDQFKQDAETAARSLNEDLKWSIAIRTGFVTGGDWYEAK